MTYYCDVCEVERALTSKAKHIISKTHINNERGIVNTKITIQDYYCKDCNYTYKSAYKEAHLQSKKHQQNVIRNNKPKIETPTTSTTSIIKKSNDYYILEKSFKGQHKTYSVNINNNIKDPFQFLEDVKRVIYIILLEELKQKNNIKVQGTLQIEFIKKGQDEDIISSPYFNNDADRVLQSKDIKKVVGKLIKKLGERIQNYQREGSNWQFNRVINLFINTNKYNPLRASSYIDLPAKLKKTEAIINIQNKTDNKCFMWSVLAGLHPIESNNNPQRVSKYEEFQNDLNF
jgi:hypothetical protein